MLDFLWEEQKLAVELAKMKEITEEDRPTVRERLIENQATQDLAYCVDSTNCMDLM